MWNPYQYQPQQQILQANGKASIDAMRLAPNSSALVMDNTAPIVWLCISDSLGNVTATAYDITLHKDAPQESGLEGRITALENELKSLAERMDSYGKSDVAGVKQRKNRADDCAD